MITKADIKQETNSVSYNYEHLGVISFKYDDEEKVLDLLLNAGIEVIDIESEEV